MSNCTMTATVVGRETVRITSLRMLGYLGTKTLGRLGTQRSFHLTSLLAQGCEARAALTLSP